MPLANAFLRDGLPASVLDKTSGSPREVWVGIRPDLAPGDGTRSNPFDGSTASKLDNLLMLAGGKIGPNTVINLQPGIFRTNGFSALTGTGWQVQTGQKFRGSGMYQTTIRLQLGASDYVTNFLPASFWALAGQIDAFLHDVEVSDLTIDLNLQNQPNGLNGKPPLIMVAAISLFGSNMKVQRVRVINFGTRTPNSVDGVAVNSAECFPITIGGLVGSSSAYNAQIDRCVFEQPYHSNARETTCALLAAGTDKTNNFPTRNEGIRRCYFNMDYVNPTPAPATRVRDIKRRPDSGTAVIATFETDYPHNVVEGDFVEISGSNNGNYNGRYEVTGGVTPPDGNVDGSSRILEVKYDPDPGTPTGGYITLQQSLPPTMRVASITYSALTGRATVTTNDKHNRRAGNWVVITGAQQAQYNGTFVVDNGSNPNNRYTFEYVPHSAPEIAPPTPATGEIWLDRRSSHFVKVKTIEKTGAQEATITTDGPHLRKPGEYTNLFGVIGGADANKYNNYFKVEETLRSENPTEGVFKIKIAEGTEAPTENQTEAFIGSHFQACSADSGPGTVMEKNRILNCRTGGTYHDTWTTDETVCRRNYYYNVFIGPAEALIGTEQGNGISPDLRKATVVSNTSGMVVIQLKPGENPAVTAGHWMNVFTTSGTAINEFVVISEVLGVNPVQIKFPSTKSYAAGQLVEFYMMFQVRHLLLFDENLIDLTPLTYIASAPPLGIAIGGRYFEGPLRGITNPWTYGQAIIRGNLIRKKDDQPDTSEFAWNTTAIWLDSAENGIIEGNILGKLGPFYRPEWVLRYSNCKTIKAFNNQNNSGKLLQLWNDGRYVDNNAGFFDDLANEAEDWIWLWKRKYRE